MAFAFCFPLSWKIFLGIIGFDGWNIGDSGQVNNVWQYEKY